jgi:predicted amidohydrolase YtcJ
MRRTSRATRAAIILASLSALAGVSAAPPLVAMAEAEKPDPQSAKADLILIHGHVLSVDAHDSIAQAIAIRRGVILKTGSDAEIEALAAPDARVIDLEGHTATPGLIDTHAHIAEGGVDELYGVKLSDAKSVAEIASRVKAKVPRVKPGEWITGAGWDEGKLTERRYPTAADLDAVAPDNPVWLMHTTGHYGVANSLAMKLAGLTAATPDPPAATIDRDAQGKPTGVFKEDAAMMLITRLIPETTPEQMRAGILYIQNVLHSEGMTAVKDPDIFQIQWDAYKALLESGQLKERICVLWDAGITMASARRALEEVDSVPRLPASLGDGRLLSCGVKLFMDGSGGARTGWMWQPWMRDGKSDRTQDGKPNTGYPHLNPDTYRDMVLMFQKARVPVGTHAVGDRAMDWVVDTYALAEKRYPHPGLRHAIIHANLPTPHALETMATLQSRYDAGYPEMQAEFLWWIGTIYASNYGHERDLRLIPLDTLRQRGILWSGGSDYSVTPLAARYGLWASVARRTSAGLEPFGMAESVDPHTALRSYTAWGARQMFLDDKIGTLEPGKRADIAVWDRNIYTIPTAQIKDMKCLMTLLDGEVVYQSGVTNSAVAARRSDIR